MVAEGDMSGKPANETSSLDIHIHLNNPEVPLIIILVELQGKECWLDYDHLFSLY
jgi:hypothetical protein